MVKSNVEIDASEIDDAVDNLARLGNNLRDDVPEKVDDQVSKLRNQIVKEIEQKGLVGDPNDKADQVPLAASFNKNKAGGSEWVIYSTADHSMAIEEGAQPHRIEPENVDLLSWVPEDPSKYPHKTGDKYIPVETWYDPEKGRVFSTGVNHPGNDAYHYVRDAQIKWSVQWYITMDNTVKEAILKAGFRRSSPGI
jgi:hypothetical protein